MLIYISNWLLLKILLKYFDLHNKTCLVLAKRKINIFQLYIFIVMIFSIPEIFLVLVQKIILC